jgi:hypothetical protein
VPNTIDQAFIKQYGAEVHEAYQRQGSKLRGLVRTKNGVRGASTTFPLFGRGKASTKPRHGEIVPMNPTHGNVEAFLQDWYAGEWVDKLDELKTNIDERKHLVNAGVYALGRRTDELITDALDTAPTSQNSGTGSDGLTRSKVLTAFEMLNTKDVPDDGRRFAVVGARQWNELLTIPEFSDADYVGDQVLPWKSGATQVKPWLGMWWMMFTGLPLAGGVRDTFMFHGDAVGHAIGADVTTDITWHGDRAAHFVNSMMSQGAVLIDAEGVVRMPALEA